MEPTITIENLQLPITKQFKYLGSVLSSDAQLDEDIKARISKAAAHTVVYKKGSGNPIVQNLTQRSMYTTVLIALLYEAETYTCYRRHENVGCLLRAASHVPYRYPKVPEIKWQDNITNVEVLQRAKMDGVEAMLM